MRPVDGRLERLLGPGAAVLTVTLDLVPDPIGILWAVRDEAGDVVDFETGYGNPAMDRMIGVPMERSFGRRLVGERPEFRADEVYRRMRDVVETGAPSVVETAVESTVGPIGTVTGVFVHRALPLGGDAVLNLVTDVTGERRLQAELERFAKVAAHDLREPLMAMGLFAGQLGRRLDRGRDPDNEHLVDVLSRTGSRAKALVDGILEYSRHGTAGGAVAVGELPTVRGDQAQLGRVLQNLVANSLKFRSAAPPRVPISAQRDDGYWIVDVRDNGIGIPEELGDDVFTMFKRAHARTSRARGSGWPCAARSWRHTLERSRPSGPTAGGPSPGSACRRSRAPPSAAASPPAPALAPRRSNAGRRHHRRRPRPLPHQRGQTPRRN